ncbi:MAG: hypothetical protein JWQ56_2758 [Pseudarthrobacter sp.]|nr:hypothetical protein [Pseudarthrobacter sp.]
MAPYVFGYLRAGEDHLPGIPAVTSVPMNKPLWICCLLGAAVGLAVGLAVFDSPFIGFALGLGAGALAGAAVGHRH